MYTRIYADEEEVCKQYSHQSAYYGLSATAPVVVASYVRSNVSVRRIVCIPPIVVASYVRSNVSVRSNL